MDERRADEPWEPGTIFGARIPFVGFCGIEPLEARDGRTRLRLALRPEHANNLGIAHGGVICTLLDVALGTAARLAAGRAVLTLDMQARFLARGTGVLTAEGRITRAGRSVLFCEAEVRAADGTLVASATGLLKPVDPRPDPAEAASGAAGTTGSPGPNPAGAGG